jgi:hypothetical protein
LWCQHGVLGLCEENINMIAQKQHRTTIRGISKENKNALKRIATENKRSVNSELLIAIEELVGKYKKAKNEKK